MPYYCNMNDHKQHPYQVPAPPLKTAAGSCNRSSADGVRDRLCAAYWRVVFDLDSLRLQQWERSNLTLPQLRVLFQIRRCPGITTGQLAKCLGITVSTTSGLVAKLADRGLLTRGTSEEDRRQIPLELSSEGLQLAGELAETTRPFLTAVIDELGDDVDQVAAALEMLAAAAARAKAR